MEDPVFPREISRTCPACNRPVGPGSKFCEFCGTRIPELSTCTRCGTRFIAPEKFCDLCGAPVILEEIPGPDELPEKNREENTGPYEDETPGRYEEEIQEPDTDESPEFYDKKNTGPNEDEIPKRYEEDIQEPDTDELLEIYGKEYADDETLDSYNTPKSPSPVKYETKKPVTIPASAGPKLPGTVNGALFLSPGNPEPVKPPVNWMPIIGGAVALASIIAAVYFIGMPLLAGNGESEVPGSVTVTKTTPLPGPAVITTITQTPIETPAPASGAFVPLPTQLVPTDQKFYFHVQKDPITAKITVIFTGSAGDGGISSADIRVTHPDGAVATGIVLPMKGVTEIILDGSKETDRVEIIATMTSGETYRVYDRLVSLWGD